MQADWNNAEKCKIYNELWGKDPKTWSDEEREFCFEMYLQEEHHAGMA